MIVAPDAVTVVDSKFGDVLRRAGDLLSHFIVALYLMVNQRPVPCGTGFFVRAGTNTYLVTAAHVLDQAERTKKTCSSTRPRAR